MWRIYYDDGSTYSSDDGSPESAVTDGILCIVEKRGEGDVWIHHGHEFYYWTGDSWAHGNQADLERWLRRDLPAVKFGRWCDNETWERVWQDALDRQDSWLSVQ